MIEAGHVDNLSLEALSPDRAPVYAGGIAILVEIFKTLNLRENRVAEGALREGLLYDGIGRLSERAGARERSVRAMAEKF